MSISQQAEDWEIQDIDNYSGENMQLVSISKKKKFTRASELEVEAYKQLPKAVYKTYESLQREIEAVDLEPIKVAIQQLNAVVTGKERKHGCSNKETKS